jgi:hypothetical protein
VLPAYGAGGIKFGNSDGIIVLDNTVSNNIGDAIHFDVDSVSAVVDGNIISGNYDPASTTEGSGSGVAIEISQGAVVRNNQISFAGKGGAVGLYSSTSTYVEAYCNVVEEETGTGPLLEVGAGSRGDYTVEPDEGSKIISSNNYLHDNTIIWSSSSNTGQVGYFLFDLTQTDFFTGNTPPNYNMYYAPAPESTWKKFVYDNETQNTDNTPLIFTAYQANGADVDGSFTTITSTTYPTATITSPANNTTASSITVQASATNASEARLYLGPVGTAASEWTLEQTISGAGPYTFTPISLPSGANEVAVMATDATSEISSCYAITANGETGTKKNKR